jgi:hypothetical protein
MRITLVLGALNHTLGDCVATKANRRRAFGVSRKTSPAVNFAPRLNQSGERTGTNSDGKKPVRME